MDNQHSRVTTLCLVLLIVTLWLVTRAYGGIYHDSRFYALQGLNALMPGRFADDLYFRYGSQDQFTLFTSIYKPFLTIFGLATGNLVLTIITQLLWLSGLFFLARSLFHDKKMMLIAVAAAVVLPGGVGFSYGEPFLTPRLLAEALTLWALGMMLRGQSLRALLLLCVSITIHPLMTLPGLAVLFLYEARKRPVWWVAVILGVILTFGLAFAGIQPFARLLVSFDPTWFAIVRVRDYFCLLTRWNIIELIPICNMLVLAAFGLTLAEPDEQRFLGSVLTVGFGGLAVSLVGGDFLHNVLIVDIQAWRATWLPAVVTNLFVGTIILRIQRRGESSLADAPFVFALAIALLTLSRFLGAVSIIATPMTVVACAVGIWEHRHQRAIPLRSRIFVISLMGVALGLTAIALYASIQAFALEPNTLGRVACGTALTVFALGATWVILVNTNPLHRWASRPIPMLCLAVTLVTIAGFNWDQRSPWRKFIDTTDTPPTSLTSLLPRDRSIYWEGDVTVPWFLLKRPSYFSCAQGTGALFSRGTAINYQHRYESFQPLRTLSFGRDSLCPLAKGHATAPLNRADLASVCKKEPGLGALVLTKAVIGAPQKIWVSPVEFMDLSRIDGKLKLFKTNRFFVYSCADLR